MSVEKTLSIIKPDGVKRDLVGEIFRRFESNGLRIIATRMQHLSRSEAEGFYAVHRERPFFKRPCRVVTGGPVVVTVLEGEDAISRHRDLMGATNPKEAAPSLTLQRVSC